MAILLLANFKQPQPGIVQEPNPMLRTLSNPVTKIDADAKAIARKLINALEQVDKRYSPWLGMAAPQIGQNKRVIAIRKRFRSYTIMVNPEVRATRFWLPAISGCFSLRGLYLIKRPYWLKVSYLDLKGRKHTETLRGGKATALQQEIDHINGKLICDV